MVFTDHVTDDTRGLLIGFVMVVAKFAHGVQHAPVDGLEAVANIGQRAPDDDAHRIVEIGLLHLLFETDKEQFLSHFSHTISPKG